jgi:hypothetical protein
MQTKRHFFLSCGHFAQVLLFLLLVSLIGFSLPLSNTSAASGCDTLAWWDTNWSYRLPITVAAQGYARTDQPAELSINFTEVLGTLAATDSEFDADSLRVVEVDSSGSVINESIVFQFDKDSDYDAATNASGTLVFLLDGSTPADATRTFYVYFDTSGGSFSVPSFENQVSVATVDDHEGQPTFQITSTNTTYYYHEMGAGFASIEDADGNDWIGYHATEGSGAQGEYRGMPNLGEWGHPGYTNGSSTLVSQGPIKATIVSTTTEGWAKEWDFYPGFARMTLLERPSGKEYWFLYEGVPGGGEAMELASDYYVLSDDPTLKQRFDTEYDAELTAPEGLEWAYFGDDSTERVLYTVHHTDDSISDSARQKSESMVIFGFGRERPTINKLLYAAPATFTVGFIETADMQQIPESINAAAQDLLAQAGKAQGHESGSPLCPPTPTPTSAPPTLTPSPTTYATETPIPSPTSTPVPRLAFGSNYVTGAPGSSFVFNASGFPENAEAEIAVKAPGSDSYQTRATWTLCEEGKLQFVWQTGPNSTPGIYRIRITVTPQDPALASVVQMEQVLSIDPEQPTRTEMPPETSLMFNDATTTVEQSIYLPIIQR